MQKLSIAGSGFQSVANRVAIVQDAAQVGFCFIRRDHFSLHSYGIDDDSFQSPAVTAKNLRRLLAHEFKERSIANHSTFQGLEQAGPELPIIQRGKQFRIHQHHPWLMKSSDQILAGAEVDPGLSSDAGIHLGQECGWNLYD